MSEYGLNALFGAGGGQFGYDLVIIDECKLYLGIDEDDALVLSNDIAHLRLVGLEKLTSCWYVIEEVLDADIGSNGALGDFLGNDLRARYLKVCADLVLRSSGIDLHVCDGTYTGECFAAEAHGAQLKEVGGLTNLRGGVAFESHARVGRAHALAVINDLQECSTTISHQDADVIGTCIQCVLHQLFEAGGRSLYHLTSCNLVGDVIWQKMDDITHNK